MKSKKGPLGTPLGNPLKYFNDQKELAKADRGRIIPSMIPDLPPEVKIPLPKRASELSMDPATDPTGPSNDRFEQRYPGSTFIDTSKYNPNSKQANVLNTLKILNEFKNRPMKKGGSVKRKKK